MIENNPKYDLEERTARFGGSIIKFCQGLNQNTINKPVISQVVRSATGIGANYMEANSASSRKDFKNKIHICKKETQETKHWLRILSVCEPLRKEEIRNLWSETQELTLIFGKIISSLR